MLAKLSKPILHQPVPRPRLFERLDARAAHPVTWICGPAGAGKSSLVAGYVEARAAKAAWVHLDAGDQDPATFFYYLRELLPERVRGQVPVLTPEHALNLAGFSHAFFRALFIAQSSESLLVFDNVQEAMSPEFALILKEGLADVPITHNLVLISRERLPANLARFRLSGTLQVIDWEDLRYTNEEASALAARLGVPGEHASSLCERVDGWAAGLVLMFSSTALAAPPAHPNEALFEYFAGEVFERASPPEREVLLAGGLLAEFNHSMISEITRIPQAHALLDRLYRAQFFMTRSEGQEPVFRFHTVFREFLLGRLELEKSAEELAALRKAAGNVLVQRRRNEEAIEMLLSVKQYEQVAVVLLGIAADLVRFGRGKVLLAWLAKLPKEQIASDPWLTYWRGAAVLWSDPDEAYLWFEKTYALFDARDDQHGRFTTTVAALNAIDFSVTDFARKDRWLERIHPLLCVPDLGSAELRLRAWCCFLVGAMDRMPSHPRIPDAVAALMDGLAYPSDSADLRQTMLNALIFYGMTALDDVVNERALAEFRASKNLDACSVSSLCEWYYWVGWYRFGRGEWEQAIVQFDQITAMAREANLEAVQRAGEAASATMHLLAGRNEYARGEFGRLSACILSDHHAAQRLIAKGFALLEMRSRSVENALHWIDGALRTTDAFGVCDLRACTRVTVAEIFAQVGQRERALEVVDQASALVKDSNHRCYDAAIRAVRVFAKHHGTNGDPSVEEIGNCMARLERHSTRGPFLLVREAAAFVLNHALEFDVAPQLARDLIVSDRLRPPRTASTTWPWQVRIRVLGTFQMVIDGTEYQSGGRSPQKVLEMLKVLALSGHRELHSSVLCDNLWPDAEGDDAKVSLHTALHRLRRVLRDEQAVRLQNGKLWLDRDLCWVDVWTFERQADSLLSVDRALNPSEQAEARRTLEWYEGSLLPGEDHPTILAARERLHAKFIKLSTRYGDALASANRWGECAGVLERALELDPGNQPLAARLSRAIGQWESARNTGTTP